ncbi:acyl-CoA dehydrogenase C-terminal domain-containing protein [Salipiger sp. P9]|uniref:acyl-CoA dehydrogenase C-terminal domain-containing protein n=1 Tax=Salipiger pentaromativorans TaxID=2943193 RepID=UPI0021572D73|nr:acyl-CoA dehydrogenase C-terminal domain-containing protein [Salipiger pentaromativorans]MCR8546838.1 acyl-CoA dehydrogenase C-terminal domain-containing protein [Salipiger pentaromativorans]
MPRYTAPVGDLMFVLHDVLNVDRAGIPGYEELDRDTTAAILGEAAKLAETVLAPLNPAGDKEGCRLENGAVRTPEGFKAAFDAMRDGGWTALDCDPAYGGQGLPYVLATAAGELFSSANMAFQMYLGLAHGAYNAIHAHGSEAQKALYLPKLARGIWGGTMNLTEPQCGTDLGLIRTRADPQPDGRYRITGQKIWISAGEHDLTDNIVHLVLARIPGGPEGVKGLSLFIVPKRLPNADGTPGARNAVVCGGLERKMGLHGNATCMMQYDGAIGELIGPPHAGLRAMFTMMNEARLAVGLQGYAQGAAAYGAALAFARERLQGRDATGVRNPAGPADPILVHPDVRRNLMDQKSFVEGARALVLWGATLIDRAHRGGDAAAEALISLLTPVIKGFLTDKGVETTLLAQQTLGGAGFTRDAGLEQFLRDARVTTIYEGTNGIQALDLVGRKLGADKGAAVTAFLTMIDALLAEHRGRDAAFDAQFLTPLAAAAEDLRTAIGFCLSHGAADPNAVLAGAYDIMHLFGHVCLGLMWTRMALAAQSALDAGGDAGFFTAKIATGRYYMARQLPATRTHLARIESGAAPVMALDAEAF